MNVEKRQRLIETLMLIGILLGVVLTIYKMSIYVFIAFPMFTFFSLIYYISVLENYEKSASSNFIGFMVSMSFSSLFIILLASYIAISVLGIIWLTVVFGPLASFLTFELSGYSFDVKIVKTEKKEEKHD